MINYLIRPRARRLLLELLWREGREGSVSELARLAGLNYQSAHRELNEMARAGVARCRRFGNTTHFSAATGNPGARVLKALFSRAKSPDWLEEARSEHFQNVRAWLAGSGAPLAAGAATVEPPDLEEVLAAGMKLARLDSSVARCLPVVLWKRRNELNFEKLRVAVRKENVGNVAGFFLELTGILAGDPAFAARADIFEDRRFRKTENFFVDRKPSRTGDELAAIRTPAAAKKWLFRMNMSQDSFESTFRKFARS